MLYHRVPRDRINPVIQVAVQYADFMIEYLPPVSTADVQVRTDVEVRLGR